MGNVGLQATVYDPSPTNTSVPGISRPVNIWINGVPYWNSQGTQIDIPRFPVLPNTNNVITITAQDQAGNTTEASTTVYVNPGIDTTAPALFGFDLPSGVVTFPAVSQVWVSGQMSNLNAIVTATVNGGAPITMNVQSNQFGYLLPVNTGLSLMFLDTTQIHPL